MKHSGVPYLQTTVLWYHLTVLDVGSYEAEMNGMVSEWKLWTVRLVSSSISSEAP